MKINKIIKAISLSTVGIFGVGAISIPIIVLSSCSTAETKISFEKDEYEVAQSLDTEHFVTVISSVSPSGVAVLTATCEGMEALPFGISFENKKDGTGELKVPYGKTIQSKLTITITAAYNGIKKTVEIIVNPVPNEEKLVYKLIEAGASYSIDVKSGETIIGAVTIPNSYEGKPVTQIVSFGFQNQKQMVSVDIAASLTSISFGAFANCTSLIDITIPASVTSIDEGAFRSCSSLTSITIPDSVVSIGNNAFELCAALVKITFNATTPPKLWNDVFSGIDPDYKIYVPASALAAYRDTLVTGWTEEIKSHLTGII